MKCTGHDLRGCPQKRDAEYETKSERTWKRGNHWVFVCAECAEGLCKGIADAEKTVSLRGTCRVE